jgi:hypothetical protein
MTTPKVVYDHLKHIEEVDSLKSAIYREEAIEVLADDSVSLKWRLAIADRLNDANHLLALRTAGGEDSY